MSSLLGFDRFIGKKTLQLHCRELHNTEIEAEHDVIPVKEDNNNNNANAVKWSIYLS